MNKKSRRNYKTPKSKEFHTRYITMWVEFPDGEQWVSQMPFIHSLEFQLKNLKWPPDICHKLLQDGEAYWKTDSNGMQHRIKVEDVKRPRRWGIQRGLII